MGGQYDPIDSGTLSRQLASAPGPVCATKLQQADTGSPAGARRTATTPLALPHLRQGNSGEDVKKLQAFLNFRLELYPPLRVDGQFDGVTRQALVDYQTTRDLRANGEVDKLTWYHLLASVEPGLGGSASQAPKAGSPLWSPPPESVMDWPLHTKFAYVVGEAPRHLSSQLRTRLSSLMPAQYLADIMESIAECLLFDVATLLGHGSIASPRSEGILELALPTRITVLAVTQPELDEAASRLAQALEGLGPAKLGRTVAEYRLVGGQAAPQKPTSGSQESSAPSQSAPPPESSGPPPEEAVFAPDLDAAAMAAAMQAAAQSGAPFCLE